MRNEVTVTCVYTEDGKDAQELLLESFHFFLRREVEVVEKSVAHVV